MNDPLALIGNEQRTGTVGFAGGHRRQVCDVLAAFQLNREAVSVVLGGPAAEFFVVPVGYAERGPAELNTEAKKRSSAGRGVFRDQNIIDTLQSQYEKNKVK